LQKPENDGKPFASPRSWTNLSKALSVFDGNLGELTDFIEEFGASYVGKTSKNAFQNWLKEIHVVDFKRLMAGQVRPHYFKREQLVPQLKKIHTDIKKGNLDYKGLNKKQKQNVDTLLEEYGFSL
jgi:hypothetical protein